MGRPEAQSASLAAEWTPEHVRSDEEKRHTETRPRRGKAASSIDTRDDGVARSSAGLALVLG